MKQKDITNYLIHYGFFFPSAAIYGGLAKSWDWGPSGVETKRKLKDLWWKFFITSSPYNVGCDSAIITHPSVLAASGHLKNFHDWLVECRNCQKRYRLDNLLPAEEWIAFNQQEKPGDYEVKEKCPHCQRNDITVPRQFNLLLTTNLEITENKENLVYLRPETCQGIFTNFSTIQRSMHKKLPFGIGQIGKSFRNEITLRHGIYRTREFEQMELEFFCQGEEREKWWNYWTEKAWNFLNRLIVNDQKKIQQVNLKNEELPHYAKKTQDLYFQYHFGWGEVCSNSQRGNYDLSQHSQASSQDLSVNGLIPEVVEVSFGVERLMLAILEDAYQEETVGSGLPRTILKLSPLLAPYFVAIIPQPIGKKDEEQEQRRTQIQTKAYQLYLDLLNEVNFSVVYEKDSNIGKSYRRQDAIGTYYCLTVDFQTLQDGTVTLRHRDSMEQEVNRINISSLAEYLNKKYDNCWRKFLQ